MSIKNNKNLIRISLFIIFFWFGLLKPLGLSAAEQLVLDTVYWMPIFSAHTWLSIIGWWEVIIGLCFLFEKTTKVALLLLLLQMTGTFMPLVILPDITFQNSNFFTPTLEGQYILKNILIIAAALIISNKSLETKKQNVDYLIEQGKILWSQRTNNLSLDKAGHFIGLAHKQRPDDFELSILMGQINYHKAYFIETETSKKDSLFLEGSNICKKSR